MLPIMRTAFAILAMMLTLSVAPVAVAAGGGGGGDHAEEGHHEHHPSYSGDADHDGVANWRDSDAEDYVLPSILFHAFNLFIFGGIVWFAAGSSIGDGIRSRALGIKRDITEATELREAAQSRHDEVASRLASLEAEISKMHEQAGKDAASEEARIKQRAEETAKRVAETAQRQIRDEATRAKNEIRREAVELAVKLAEDILKSQVQPGDQRELARQFLDTLQSDGDSHV